MAKKLISVWLSLAILIFSSISIYAEEYVRGDFFDKEVVINGTRIVNYNLQYPLFIYKGTTYLPMTPEMGNICGFKAEMDWESRTLKLQKTEVTQKQLSKNWAKTNGTEVKADVQNNVKLIAYSKVKDAEVYSQEGLAGETGLTEVENAEEINLGGMPILTVGKFVFVPLRAMKESKVFAWDLHYDASFGICVSTEPGKTAKSYLNEAEAKYNRGLAGYIRHYNPNVSEAYAQNIVFLFKRAAQVYNVDEKLLISIAHRESTFYPNAVSRSGATGLMQIMPRTGANFGVTVGQLHDPRTNINIAASMLNNGLSKFNGDKIRTISAYSYGSPRVSRGNYSTAYATKIMATYVGIENFLSVNGYR